MAQPASVVVEVTENLVDVLGTVPDFKNKVFPVYNLEQLLDKVKGITSVPQVGILYEGMRRQASNNKAHDTGMASEMMFSLLIITQSESTGPTTQASKALVYLDSARRKLMNTRGITQSFWGYQFEAPVTEKANKVVWQQRWTLPCILSNENTASRL